MSGSPFVIVTVLLTLGVILVNGRTDAPNSIATCVYTRAIKPKTAVNAKVASTIFNMVDFGENTGDILHAKAIRKLYSDGSSDRDVIIWSNVYEDLEDCLDAAENCVAIIESVIMKNT